MEAGLVAAAVRRFCWSLLTAVVVVEGVLLLEPLTFMVEKQLPISQRQNRTPKDSNFSLSLSNQGILNIQIKVKKEGKNSMAMINHMNTWTCCII